MQDILSSLAVGLHKAETTRTANTLGDRSRYVGMSDIGKAADCLRAAVIGTTLIPRNPAICSRFSPGKSGSNAAIGSRAGLRRLFVCPAHPSCAR